MKKEKWGKITYFYSCPFKAPTERVKSWELRTERYDYLWYCPNSQTPKLPSSLKLMSTLLRSHTPTLLKEFKVQGLPTDSHRFSQIYIKHKLAQMATNYQKLFCSSRRPLQTSGELRVENGEVWLPLVLSKLPNSYTPKLLNSLKLLSTLPHS